MPSAAGGAVTPRSPDTVLALITGIDVVNNFAFLPHRRVLDDSRDTITPRLTLCNAYVTACTAGLGCAIPPMLANKQHAWLKSNEGMLAGWMPVDPETARQRAQLGYPTVAAVMNLSGHGHIALVVPQAATEPPGLYVSSAGATNFIRTPMARSFGALKPSFFTHD